MSNETNNQILKNISKELLNGLFPYVFANIKPTAINKSYNYNINYVNRISRNNLVASKTRKKIIYKPHSVDWKSICLLNYNDNINYSAEVYFKNKEQFKLNNNVRRHNNSKFSKKSLNNNTLGRRFTSNNIINNNLNLYSNYKEYRRNSSNIRNNIGTIYKDNNYKRRLHNNIKFY